MPGHFLLASDRATVRTPITRLTSNICRYVRFCLNKIDWTFVHELTLKGIAFICCEVNRDLWNRLLNFVDYSTVVLYMYALYMFELSNGIKSDEMDSRCS